MKPSIIDIENIRADFPILQKKVNGKPLVYMDSAASNLKPKQVVERLTHYYREESSNIHRGVYYLSEQGTINFEKVRCNIAKFIGAKNENEIIFTSGTTDSINLVAATVGEAFIKAGDEILISCMEHHSNIVPWQMVADKKKAQLKVIDITDEGEIDLSDFQAKLSPNTKMLALVHTSNTLGTVNPVKEMTRAAHEVGAKVLIDAAQAVAHNEVNVRELDCDFLAFSGHKMFGPTGIGVLYGKEDILNSLPPYRGGGDMILNVTFAQTTYKGLPYKFEAGTPHIAGVIGLGAAIDYIQEMGLAAIASYEKKLLDSATETLSQIPGLKIYGRVKHKGPILSFTLKNAHPHDIGTLLDQEGIAVRTGHHCTQPIMDRYQIPATTRLSFSLFNTKEEIDFLAKCVRRIGELFS